LFVVPQSQQTKCGFISMAILGMSSDPGFCPVRFSL
jgi:hypothetical protein